MILPTVVFGSISIAFAVLQTNFLSFVSIQGVLPDVSYIVIIYFSFLYGVMQGQIGGFVSGLVLDFISLSPFGFNSFVRTVSCHIVGRFKGMVLLDSIFLPIALVGIALICKALVATLLGLFLGVPSILFKVFSTQFLIEFLFTVLVTPLVFWPLRAIHSLLQSRRAYR